MSPPNTRSGGRLHSSNNKHNGEHKLKPLNNTNILNCNNTTEFGKTKTSTSSNIFARSCEVFDDNNSINPTPQSTPTYHELGAFSKVNSIRPLNTELSFLPNKSICDDSSALLPQHFSELGITPLKSYENTPHSSRNTTPLSSSSRANSLNLNNIFTERMKNDERVDLLASSVKQIGHQLQGSWSNTNENFNFFLNQITNIISALTSIKSDINVLVGKVDKLESITLSQCSNPKTVIEDNCCNDSLFSNLESINPSYEEQFDLAQETSISISNNYPNNKVDFYSKSSTPITQVNRNANVDIHSQVPVNPCNNLNPFIHSSNQINSIVNENTFTHINCLTPKIAQPRNNFALYPNSAHNEREERLVQNTISLAKRIIDINIVNSSKADTLKLVSFDAKKLSSYKTDLKKYQINLQSIVCSQTLDLIDATLIEIEQWENTLNDLQKQYYMHLSSERSLLTLVDLKPFDGSVEGDTVYHFLNIFNTLADACHGPNEKAQLLFKSYLSDSLKVEVEPYLPHFQEMSAYLLSRFGDPRKIAEGKRRKIASLKYPSDPEGQISYYKNTEALILHLESLASAPDVNAAEVLAAVHNVDFVESIVAYLPRNLINTYSRKIEQEPQVPNVSGKKCFEILKNVVSSEWRHISQLHNLTNVINNSKSVTKTQNKFNSVTKVDSRKKVSRSIPKARSPLGYGSSSVSERTTLADNSNNRTNFHSKKNLPRPAAYRFLNSRFTACSRMHNNNYKNTLPKFKGYNLNHFFHSIGNPRFRMNNPGYWHLNPGFRSNHSFYTFKPPDSGGFSNFSTSYLSTIVNSVVNALVPCSLQ